jgi:hypothetical protein
MKKIESLTTEFLDSIPVDLDCGVLYISMKYSTAIHKCCCGCKNEVVTPLSPTDWKLIFDGRTVSLEPSIGNWNFPCRSHYFITGNQVRWVPQWSEERVSAGRAYNVYNKENNYSKTEVPSTNDTLVTVSTQKGIKSKESFWMRLKKWLL